MTTKHAPATPLPWKRVPFKGEFAYECGAHRIEPVFAFRLKRTFNARTWKLLGAEGEFKSLAVAKARALLRSLGEDA